VVDSISAGSASSGDTLRYGNESSGIQYPATINSASATESIYPTGYSPLCETCSFLAERYGPDDGELLFHCRAHIENLFDEFHIPFGDGTTYPNYRG
jgi:hypothetical protein